jgi:hypothetical protein
MTLDDARFLAAVADGSLPAGDFDHRQHLRLARLHLQGAPLDVAIERTCADIARFAARHGAHAKFHRTITEALLRLMAARGPDDVALRDDARGLLARHYSPTLLASNEARLRFLPPDLLPLPA